MSRQYRTQKQFEKIVEQMTNGNWEDAAEKCVEYGFYANDLVQKLHDEEYPCNMQDLAEDLIYLAEYAAEIRNDKLNEEESSGYIRKYHKELD